MLGWFGRKSAPEKPQFVPAWLTGESGQDGFARGYQAQLEEVYRRNPVGLRAVRLVAGLAGGLPIFGDERAVKLVKAAGLLERIAASLRPPSPCHLTLRRDGTGLVASWTRRSHRGWAWIDGVGVPDDPFPETYRLQLTGAGGTMTFESISCSAAFGLAELPGKAGEAIMVAVSIAGPAALSHPATASIIL